MAAYYNEIDPYAAEWLRNLIKNKHIADGDVDERSICEVDPQDIRDYTQCHFFAGIGGWSYALRLAGWPDDRPVWTGSCPCQPFSAAGQGKAFADERHLWPDFYRLIAERRPSVIFGEQVASKHGLQWLDLVCADMEGSGYAVGAADLCAASVGALHNRPRLWFVADAQWDKQPRQKPRSGATGRMGRAIKPFSWDKPWSSALSSFRAVDDGLPRRVGATDAARNAIVPQVAAEFIGAYLDT